MKRSLIILGLLIALVGSAFMLTATAADPELPATCPHCKTAVTWQPITESIADAAAITAGHHYLAFEDDTLEWSSKSIPRKVCIYMNGKTVQASSSRAFSVAGELSLIGEGTVLGRGFTSTGSNGGAINVTGTVNLYGPTVSTTGETGRTAGRGGVVYLNGGTLNVYSGSVTGGTATNGGTIYVAANGFLNVQGGTITGGTATGSGGAIYLAEAASAEIADGQITGGNAAANGGSVYVHTGATFTVSGGSVGGGKAGTAGGSVYVYGNGTLKATGGSILTGASDTSSTGTCAYLRSGGFAELSGTANITELRFAALNTETLTVSGGYSGTTVLRYNSGSFADGTVIGISNEANLRRAQLTLHNNGNLYIIAEGSELKLSAQMPVFPLNTRTAYCSYCQRDVEWLGLTEAFEDVGTYMSTGHYYLDFAGNSADFDKRTIVGDDIVCLDLNGKHLRGTEMALEVHTGTLNVMDNVGGGLITGQGAMDVSTVYGGSLFVRDNGTLNLYSGKLSYEFPADDRSLVSRGGVVYVRGEMNIYGGEISGGAATAGANIYVDSGSAFSGKLGLFGGTVGGHATTSTPTGLCIYSKGQVVMSGAPTVTELRFSGSDLLEIKGEFSGNVKLRFTSFTDGMDIGTNTGAVIGQNAVLNIHNNANAKVICCGSDLLAVTSSPKAVLFGSDGSTAAYADLASAIGAFGDSSAKIVLLADAAVEEAVTLSRDVYVDLNGNNISGNITGTNTLYCMDSKTDDYTVADEDYGTVSGVTCGLAGVPVEADCAEDGYLMIEQDGAYSFHRVNLQIKSMSLRPSGVGLYFKSNFAGDEMVADAIDSFGVALSLTGEPSVAEMGKSTLYTSFDKKDFNSDTQNTSTLVSGIMKPGLQDSKNQERAGMSIFGRAYIQIGDQIIFGAVRSRNLKEQVAGINSQWEALTVSQKKLIMNFYSDYSAVMTDESWDVSNPASIAARWALFEETDYTPYLAPWEEDVVASAIADGKNIHYYFMAGEGLLISSTQTQVDKWGDACLIVFPNGKTMLIDCGPLSYGPVLAENLRRMGITRLDYLVITHPHSDHQNGFFSDANLLLEDSVLNTVEIGQIFHRGGYDPARTSATLVARVAEQLNIPIDIMEKGDVLNIGDVRVEVVWPLPGAGDTLISGGEEVNNMSIVIRFDYGEHSSLFTADLYTSGEEMILKRVDNDLLDVDFLKVPHHAYLTSSSEAFLRAISPEIAVATGRLLIPARLRDRYANLNINLLDDLLKGYIHVTADADGVMEYTHTRNNTVDDFSDAGSGEDAPSDEEIE